MLVFRPFTHTVIQNLGAHQENETDPIVTTDYVSSSSSVQPPESAIIPVQPMCRSGDGVDDSGVVGELAIHGVIINSVCCVESQRMGGSDGLDEGTRQRERVHGTSVVEHSLLSGDFAVGRRAVVSHVTGICDTPTH